MLEETRTTEGELRTRRNNKKHELDTLKEDLYATLTSLNMDKGVTYKNWSLIPSGAGINPTPAAGPKKRKHSTDYRDVLLVVQILFGDAEMEKVMAEVDNMHKKRCEGKYVVVLSKPKKSRTQ